MKLFLLTFMLVLALTDNPPQQPVIGIYTQDAQTFLTQQQAASQTYIAASYVKNIQMAGAQVVPIFYHLNQADLKTLLGKINGVFLPGGQMPIDEQNHWTSNIATIFGYANKKNKEGTPYPIWATCLGYQAMMYITSGQDDNTTVFTQVFGQGGKTCPLSVKNGNSQLLNSLNSEQYTQATTGDGLFFYHHRWSVLQTTFNENSVWKSMWKLTSTSKTEDGTEFIASVQSIDYPYFMTQFHPEKNSFEWRVPAKRTYNAISAEQKYINVFMKYARRNPNVYPADELKKDIIYNYQPILTPLSYSFVQAYVFDESHLVEKQNLKSQ